MNGVSFWNRMELVGLLPINTCNANRDVNSLFRVETIIENRDLLKLFNQNIRQLRITLDRVKKKGCHCDAIHPFRNLPRRREFYLIP